MENQIKLSDKELLNELSMRFEQNRKMLHQMEELNEKLIDSEMMKSHFLSNIKNEINNPISAILGLSQGMITKKDDVDFIENSSKLIHEEAFSLNFQLKNIFCAAEIEGGQSFPEVSNVNINKLIENICESQYLAATRKNNKLIFEEQDILIFQTDAQKLSMILNNLISNAIKFSHDNNIVKVSAVINSQNELVLIVEDFGVGLEKEKEEIIFDRFKQLENGTTKEFSGHGLGLSIVSSLVDILSGKIKINCNLGKGCKFIINLPKGINNTNEISESDNSFLFFENDSSEEIF